ncbi:MAG: tetratricopeptide repeat protein [Nitrosopumilaceae archaeon]
MTPIFAEEINDENPSLILKTDKSMYQIGESLIISGNVEEKKMPVAALRLFDPQGGILLANNLELEDDKTFSKTIILEPSFYDTSGSYIIQLDYGKLKAETTFDIIYDDEISEDSILDEFDEIIFPEIIVMTDKSHYQDGDTITIVGFVSELREPSVLVGIYDPFGFPTGFYFGEIDSNFEFIVNFLVKSGVNFKTEGEYSIIARYGDSNDRITFEFNEKFEETIPEPVIEPTKTVDEIEDNQEVKDDTVKNEIIQNNDHSSTEYQKIKKDDNKLIKDENVVKKDNQKKYIAQDSSSKKSTNLSVEDIELGKILNQIHLNCDHSEFTDIISYYDSMGPALIRLCKYNDAITYYDQTLIENPTNVDAIINKGSALARIGLFEEAITFYNSVIDVDSNNIEALNNKANALANLDDYEQAISLYNKALLLAPSNTIILENLEIAKEKIPVSQEQNEEITLNYVVENIEKIPTEKPKIEKNEEILEQISNVFSSIGNALFGFLS